MLRRFMVWLVNRREREAARQRRMAARMMELEEQFRRDNPRIAGTIVLEDGYRPRFVSWNQYLAGREVYDRRAAEARGA